MAEGDGPTWQDTAVACATGVAVALLAWVSGNSAEIPPDLWTEISVAMGIRPPPTVFPGLWRCFASVLFESLGGVNGLMALRLLGPVSLGVLAVLVIRVFDEVLPATLRYGMRRKGWSRRIVRLVLIQGALFFVCSDPVWRAGQILSPTMLMLLLTLVAFRIFLHAMRTSNRRYAILMSALLGVLSAETPFGVLPMFVFPFAVIRRIGSSTDEAEVPLANPLVRLALFRRMSLAFLGAALLMVTANAFFFACHDGLAAHGWDAFDYCFRYLHRYVEVIRGMASPLGWLFIGSVVVFPLVMSSLHVGRATDDDRFLDARHALYFGCAGLLALLQSLPWKPFWFWTWAETTVPVRSGYLLCLCLLATSLTAMLSLCVLGVEIYFRNYRRIAFVRYQDAIEDEPDAERMAQSFRPVDRVLRTILFFEPAVMLALIVPVKFMSPEHEMAAIVNAGVFQTAEECGDAKVLFTDGALDAGIETAAALQGRDLKALSMLASTHPYEIYLRTRGETDDANRATLAVGAADALRTWVRAKSACATNIALQLGFELWRHDKLPMPPCGGLVARTAGFAPGAADDARQKAIALADRILSLYGRCDPMAIANRELKSMFVFLQWRLARMCGLRADEADRAHDMSRAMEESERADRLDAKNASYRRIRQQMDWVGQRRGMQLTPREGLKIGLDRADFRMARTFAQQILVSDPYNTAANFAMGMGYFMEEQYGRAEVFLKRCLVNRPDEPAVLNNLAIAQLRQGKLGEAETNAAHALKVRPNAIEIRQTFDHIRNVRQK